MKHTWTKTEITFLIENYKYGANHCVTRLNIDKKSIRNKAHALKLKVRHYGIKYGEDNLRLVLNTAKSYNEAFKMLGVKPIANQYRRLRAYADKYNIDITHYKLTPKPPVHKPLSLEEVLEGKHPTYDRGHLKRRLYDTGLKKRICELCGQDENWKGKKMSLILDHINGVRDDHRLKNLRIVCPNCNATLDTFSGKNTHKKERVDKRKINAELKFAEQSVLIPQVLNSGIDFSKFGWVGKVAPIIKRNPQKVHFWMKKYMNDFYKTCFQRKSK